MAKPPPFLSFRIINILGPPFFSSTLTLLQMLQNYIDLYLQQPWHPTQCSSSIGEKKVKSFSCKYHAANIRLRLGLSLCNDLLFPTGFHKKKHEVYCTCQIKFVPIHPALREITGPFAGSYISSMISFLVNPKTKPIKYKYPLSLNSQRRIAALPPEERSRKLVLLLGWVQKLKHPKLQPISTEGMDLDELQAIERMTSKKTKRLKSAHLSDGNKHLASSEHRIAEINLHASSRVHQGHG
ncbi:hypothetical protein NC652_035702 [Populus alba x Populus x berolinensis]|nr:hypothetical protein NC652_035702 [Populus alba x Populus x berolinensis]